MPFKPRFYGFIGRGVPDPGGLDKGALDGVILCC